jgi:Protein of unknown function (DUF1244)
MMDLTGFCRNCLASWMLSEAEAVGLTVTRDEGLRAAQTPRNSIEMVFVHSSGSRPSHDEDRTRPCPSSQSINRRTWASPINPRVKGKPPACLPRSSCLLLKSNHAFRSTRADGPFAKPTHRVGVPKSPNSLPVGTGDMCQGHV